MRGGNHIWTYISCVLEKDRVVTLVNGQLWVFQYQKVAVPFGDLNLRAITDDMYGF